MANNNLAEYERAIVLSFELVQNPSSQQQRAMQMEAAVYCEQVETAPGGWLAPVQLLATSLRSEVKFYCLQALQKLLNDNARFGNMSDEERLALRNQVLAWVASACPTLQQEQRFVRSKLGVVLALLIKREYTRTWPSAFDDLLQLVSLGIGGADVLIATLSALDEEVIAVGGPEATTIKDTMRQACVAKLIPAFGDIALMYADLDVDLVRRCWTVCGPYVDWVDIGLTTADRFLQIWFSHCLDERFRNAAVRALAHLLQKGMDSTSKSRLIQQLGLADACVEFCLRSALPFGTGNVTQVLNPDVNPPATAWNAVVTQYKTVARPQYQGSAQDHEAFALDAAYFCQTLGLQLLECRKTFIEREDVAGLNTIRALVEKALFCLFSFMGRMEKLEVQRAVLEFANRIVTSNKDTPNQSRQEIVEYANFFGPESVHRMLFAVLACVRLPEGINLKSVYLSMGADGNGYIPNGNGTSSPDPQELANDDEESEFREHRSDVKRLYLNLVRCATPKVVLPFLLSVTKQCLASYSPKQAPHDVEAVLYLIHAFGEGATEISQRQGSPDDIAAFDEVLNTVFLSPVFSGPAHPLLAIMFNELVARYVVAIKAQPTEMVGHVIERMTGNGGLHHTSMRVRSKAATLLLRMVRSLEVTCVPFAERILLELRDVVAIPFELCALHLHMLRRKGASRTSTADSGLQKSSRRFALYEPEVILVFETVGILLGNPIYWPNESNRRIYLRAVVGPVQANLEQACHFVGAASAGVNGSAGTPKVDELVHWGACQLEALASLAKGFASQTDTPDILELWKDVMRTSLMAAIKLQELNQDVEILLGNLRRLCHSMIRTISVAILDFFPEICRALFESPNADICRSLPLLNQMMTAFKGRMHESLATSLLPILRSTNARIAPVAKRENPTVHDRDELIAMEKELFTFLSVAASSDLARVFCEGPNRNHIEELLRMITDGLASVPDAGVQRVCGATLIALAKEWLPRPSHFPDDLYPALVQFFFERVTPASFQATAQSHFDHRDAACNQALVTVCTLHRTLFDLCGQDWLEYLRRVFFPSVNCPPPVADQYCHAVSQLKNPKDLRNEFRKLFLEDNVSKPMN